MLIFGDYDRDSDVDDIGDVKEMTSTMMMMMMMIMTMTNMKMIIKVINDNGGGDCEEMILLKTSYITFDIVFAPIQQHNIRQPRLLWVDDNLRDVFKFRFVPGKSWIIPELQKQQLYY